MLMDISAAFGPAPYELQVLGQVQDVVVPVTDRQVVRAIPTDTPVREVQINRDFAALAEFDER